MIQGGIFRLPEDVSTVPKDDSERKHYFWPVLLYMPEKGDLLRKIKKTGVIPRWMFRSVMPVVIMCEN
jgi:hypothetical protein